MTNSRKKVIVRRFTGDTLPGYLPLTGFVRREMIDLLDLEGRIVPLSVSDVKTICFVKDFNLSDTLNPERLLRKTFLARPRTEGLWVRLTFRSGDILEGLAPIDISLLHSIADDAGLTMTPPDTRSNTQRIFVPRTAITDLQIVAVVTTPSRRRPLPAPEADRRKELQDELFHAELPPNTRPN